MSGIMNLATAFAASVEKRPDKIALYWGESEFSYAMLSAQSRAVAAELGGKFGVKSGDRVALWVKNCPEFVSSVFGILSAGGVVVPINNFFKPAEVGYIVNDAGANVLITDAELAAHSDILKAARPALEILRIEQFGAIGATDSRFTVHDSLAESDLGRCSTRPARPAIRRARCSRTAIFSTTWRVA